MLFQRTNPQTGSKRWDLKHWRQSVAHPLEAAEENGKSTRKVGSSGDYLTVLLIGRLFHRDSPRIRKEREAKSTVSPFVRTENVTESYHRLGLRGTHKRPFILPKRNEANRNQAARYFKGSSRKITGKGRPGPWLCILHSYLVMGTCRDWKN